MTGFCALLQHPKLLFFYFFLLSVRPLKCSISIFAIKVCAQFQATLATLFFIIPLAMPTTCLVSSPLSMMVFKFELIKFLF